MEETFENIPKKIFEIFRQNEKIFQQNEEILEQLRRINPPKQAEQHFDIDEVCIYLPQKPARATVYGWVHTNHIPFHKRGKNLYFLKSEIDNWLMQGKN